MRRLIFFSFVVAIFVALATAAKCIAAAYAWDYKLTFLAVLVFVSTLASIALAWQRHHLRRSLLSLSVDQVDDLAEEYDEVKYAFPSVGISALRNTVLAGVTCISGPIIPLMVLPLYLVQTWIKPEPPVLQPVALALGFVLAWLWWSVGVSIWRRWAARRGLLPGEIQFHGERVKLLWPNGHFFERTEWANLFARLPSGDV